MTVEVHQLKMLRELGARGSVTAVASALGISPSAVSQHLAALQRNFPTLLTRMEGRRLVLTDAGAVLAAAGGEVIDAMARAQTAVEVFEGSASGKVSLCGFHSVGQALFGAVAADLRDHAPFVEASFSDEDVAQEDFPALTSRYDVVLAHRLGYGPPWPADGPRIVHLLAEPLDVALPAGHDLARRNRLTPHDLVGQRWVASRHGYSPDDVLGAIAAGANRSLHVVHRINDYATVAAVVSAGDAVGLLPRYTSRGLDRRRIALRPLSGVVAARSIDVLARPESLRRRSVRMVVASLRRVVGQLIAAES